MTRAHSSRNSGYSRAAFPIIEAATGGDTDAMAAVQRHYEPYIRKLATITVCGVDYLNADLYDRLKTRLIVATLKFRF